jgi:hypothetical protein
VINGRELGGEKTLAVHFPYGDIPTNMPACSAVFSHPPSLNPSVLNSLCLRGLWNFFFSSRIFNKNTEPKADFYSNNVQHFTYHFLLNGYQKLFPRRQHGQSVKLTNRYPESAYDLIIASCARI